MNNRGMTFWEVIHERVMWYTLHFVKFVWDSEDTIDPRPWR